MVIKIIAAMSIKKIITTATHTGFGNGGCGVSL
jgi:hypothetical protein